MIPVEKREEIRKQVFGCPHKRYERRQQVLSNNATQVKHQCLDCGIISEAKKKQPGDEKLPKIDKDFAALKLGERNEECRRQYDQIAEAEKQKMQYEYAEYLATPEWKEIRRKVLVRDGNLCRGCLVRQADCVHHLTYNNVGSELCFQLVSLCNDCHSKAHQEANND